SALLTVSTSSFARISLAFTPVAMTSRKPLLPLHVWRHNRGSAFGPRDARKVSTSTVAGDAAELRMRPTGARPGGNKCLRLPGSGPRSYPTNGRARSVPQLGRARRRDNIGKRPCGFDFAITTFDRGEAGEKLVLDTGKINSHGSSFPRLQQASLLRAE